MRIVFDPDLGSGAWPGPLRGGCAAAGEEWCGAERLLEALETALGLPSRRLSLSERAARLVPTVRATAGFWSASAEIDPFGTARQLLEWRDRLALGGWRGAARESRLAALGALTAGAAPGEPDRLRAIVARLARRDPGLETLELFSPRDDFELAWRDLFAALESGGTRVIETTLPPAATAAGGNLAGAREPRFLPREGDPSLLILRPAGVLAAAEEVAAWLAALPSCADVLLVGGDPALDAALRRHGLPTTGAPSDLRESAPLQVLPLVLDLAWTPPDPQRAFELLSLRASPVPSAVRGRLRGALERWPAVDSDPWREALREGLAAIEDPDRRARAQQRNQVIWDARTPRGTALPVAEVERRTGLLRTWMLGRREIAGEQAQEWGAAAAQCGALLDLVSASGLDTLAAPQLRRLVLEATRAADPGAPHPAEAGLARVGAPGAVCGPARRIVWWGFDEASAPGVARLPLTGAERADLEAQRVALPDAGAVAAAAARRWNRPLTQAAESLLLVCSMTGGAGQDLHPHPLWDEIVARVNAKNTRRTAEKGLMRSTLADLVPRQARARLPLPAPRRDWTVPAGRIVPPAAHSPTGLEALFGCPLRWTLEHVGRLRQPAAARLADGTSTQMLGRLLHAILDRLFSGPPCTPDEAARAAAAILREEGPRLVAALFMPGAEALLHRTAVVAGRTAHDLYALMAERGLHVVANEQELERPALGGGFHGRVDVVLGEPPRILDLKWGGASGRRRALAGGTAIQLASYAYLVGGAAGALPPVGYYVMDSQRLITTAPEAFAAAEAVEGPSPAETWQLVEATHGLEWRAVADGRLEARGIVEDEDGKVPKEARVENGRLVVPPHCEWCSFETLCGRAFAEEA